MSEKNRRIVFPEQDRVELEEVDLTPCQSDQFRVRHELTAISTGSELAHLHGPEWRKAGEAGIYPNYPHYPGYCGVGEVVEVGSGCAGIVSVGDLVATSAPHQQYTLCWTARGAAYRGLWWEVEQPAFLSDAVWTNLGATVINAVSRGGIDMHTLPVVLGLGVVGQLLLRALDFCSTRRQLGLDHNEARVRAAGSDRAGEPRARLWHGDTTELLTFLEWRAIDAIFECTGRAAAYTEAFELAAPGGTVVSVGSPRIPGEVDLLPLHQKGLTLVGACSRTEPRPGQRGCRLHNGTLFLDMCWQGLDALSMVTHHVPWREAAGAWDIAARRTAPDAIGVLIDWSEDR